MKVCDKHPDRRATDTIRIERDDAHIDVCSECKTDVLLLLTAPAEVGKKRGRPPKDLAQAN